MTIGPKVICGKTFKSMQIRMTLTLDQGHWAALKFWQNELLLISQTLIAVEHRNLHWFVGNDETFPAIYNMMT